MEGNGLDFLISLFLTIMCYCTIPVIIRFTLLRNSNLSKKKAILITISNSVVIFCVINLITYDGNGVSLYPAIIWGIVNYFILNSCNDKNRQTKSEVSDSPQEVSSENEDFAISAKGEHEDKILQSETTSTQESQQKKIIPKSTKICIIIIVAFVFAAGIGGYLGGQHLYNTAYNDGYSQAKSESNESTYKGYLTYFLDCAVFVTEKGEKYHRLGCYYIQDSKRFWVYNPENAENQGYDACSYCFGKDAPTFIEEDLL